MSEGWIKLHRKIRGHTFYQEKRKFSRFEAWLDLLMTANHKDTKILHGNEILKVKRGSFVTSEIKLMEKWKWSKSKLRAFLRLLENDQMIVKITDTKKTTITIVNYGFYQDEETTKEPIKDHEETAKRPQKDTNKNEKNDKNKDMSNDISGATIKPDPRVKNLIDYYFTKFVEKFNEKPAIHGKKDGAIIKRLLGTYGEDKLKGLIDRFFESTDAFIVESGYTLGVFTSQVNKLIAQKGADSNAYDLLAYKRNSPFRSARKTDMQ